jgi:cytochrome c-type biogenesis protein CcmH/NrfF
VRRALALALLAASIVAPAAQAACPKTSLGDVEDEVMCPQCGVPLELATEAPQAKRERAFIQEQIAACRSKEEIKDSLRAEFGDAVLALPDDEGFDLAAYLVPALALAAALAALALALVRWRRRPSAAGAAEPPPPDPADAARLDADLERRT